MVFSLMSVALLLSVGARAFVGGVGGAARAAARRGGVLRQVASVVDDDLPSPRPLYDPAEVVAMCMSRLQENDTPRPNAGLEVCFRFSNDMCRAAAGGTSEKFYQYAANPTFSSMVNSDRWTPGEPNLIAGTPTRGALATVLVRVTPRGADRERKFLWTLQEQRRPPLQGCWLVRECLAVERAIIQTL